MDVFEIIGPVMVGPSSSHTAGAVRIGLVAAKLLGSCPVRAEIYLHGSFAATGRGHGTDKAIIAGLLGLTPDDSRIPDAFQLARDKGMEFSISETQLRNAHPNSALIRVWDDNESAPLEIIGASIGGGRIQIQQLFGMKLTFTAELPTLIVQNLDTPGSVAEVSELLSSRGINIATFQVNRNTKGGKAVMVIECDAGLTQGICDEVRQLPDILDAVAIEP